MSFASGIIGIWSGAIVDIPIGWVLCDGNNGTPDLRNRFIVGAGDTHAVDDTGGTTTHRHTFTSDGHTHTLLGGTTVAFGSGFNDDTDAKVDSGLSDASGTLPSFYALAFIMKT